MSVKVAERSFEEAIECALLENGPDACPGDAMIFPETPAPYGGVPVPGGYQKRRPQDYDRGLCLLSRDVVDFILATQPKEWEKLRQHHGTEVKERFLARLSREIGRRGALDVLRNGVKDSGCVFRLAFFRPASGLNEALQRMHAANLFAVVRQLRYSEKDGKSLDLVLFLNGIPIFTAELTDPNLLYEIQGRLIGFGIYTEADVDAFARVYFDRKATQDQLYAALAPVRQRFDGLSPEEQKGFRGELTDYVRLYAFLAQVLSFADVSLEKLYVFARHLRRLLPSDRDELPREVQQSIDMESYRIQQTSGGAIRLERRAGQLEPMRTRERHDDGGEELEPLSQIIAELNERFGLNLGPEHKVTLEQIRVALDQDPGLDASARVNARENVRLTFDPKVEDKIQEIVETNFELYRRITDDPAFGQAIKNLLFDDYIRRHRRAEDLLKLQESKTLEFKSSLRWNLKEDRKDDDRVTYAVLKTIAAFLNTDGGDLLVGVADDRTVLGIEHDRLENDDKFMRHLIQVVRNGLGDRAGTCVDPRMQIVQGKTVCLVACQRSPEPVFLKWNGVEAHPGGDFYVRSGPRTDRLSPDSAEKYMRTRFRPQSAEGSETGTT